MTSPYEKSARSWSRARQFRWARAVGFGRYNRKAAPSLDWERRALYPMPAGTRERITIAGRPWERVWRADGTYECAPIEA